MSRLQFEVDISPEAEEEAASSYLWLHERSPLAAESLREEIFRGIEWIREAPRAWPQNREGVRKFVVQRHPYSIYYEVESERVTILAVAHHRRKPNYWRERRGS